MDTLTTQLTSLLYLVSVALSDVWFFLCFELYRWCRENSPFAVAAQDFYSTPRGLRPKDVTTSLAWQNLTCLLFHWNCPSMFFSHHPSLFLSDLSQKWSLWLTKKQSACNTLWKKGENDGKNVKNRLLSSRHQLLCLWIEHRVEPEVCLEIGSCQQQFCFRHVFVCMFALRCMFSENPPCEHRQDLQGDTFKHQVPDWVLQASRLCFHPSVFSQRPYSVALKFSVCPRTAGLSVMKETKQNACSCICVCKDLDTLSIACWSVSHVIVQVKQSSSLFCTWTICVPYLKNKGKEKEHMTIMTCFWHKKPKEWPPCLAHRLKQSKRLVDC